MSWLYSLIINCTLKVSVRYGLDFIMPSLSEMFDYIFLNIIKSVANSSHFLWLAIGICFVWLHKAGEKLMLAVLGLALPLSGVGSPCLLSAPTCCFSVLHYTAKKCLDAVGSASRDGPGFLMSPGMRGAGGAARASLVQGCPLHPSPALQLGCAPSKCAMAALTWCTPGQGVMPCLAATSSSCQGTGREATSKLLLSTGNLGVVFK